MRLWHQNLVPDLSLQWLIGQHRECSALRGLGWGKKHSTVDYVFNHSFHKLWAYHCYVMDWIKYRKPDCKIDPVWYDHDYRGKKIGHDESEFTAPCELILGGIIYPEHDGAYLFECMSNLFEKQKQGKKPFWSVKDDKTR